MTDQQPPHGPPPSYTPPPQYPPPPSYPQGPPTSPGMPQGPPTGPGFAPPPPPKGGGNGVAAWWLPVVACLCLAIGAVIGAAVAGGGDDGDDTTSDTTTTEAPEDDEEPSSTTEDEEPTTTEEQETTTTEEEEEETTTTEEEAPANPTFGETFEWDDGLAISVAAPTPFTPSETAAGGEGAAAFVQFEVRVTNGSDVPYEPTFSSITVQSGSAEGDQVFDSGQGFTGAPATPVLPGREVVFKVGFGVSDPADIVMQISPDFEHDPAFFTS